MARSRNIKPSFFQNDLLAEIHPLGRLLFAGLWTVADRSGRLEDRPKRIKASVLPYDDIDTDTLLNQLAEKGFINRYNICGNAFIEIKNFIKHQNPHCREPESTIPAPDEFAAITILASDKHCAGTVQALDEHSSGRADSLNLIPDSFHQASSRPANIEEPNGFKEFWAEYPKKAGKSDAIKAWQKLKPSRNLVIEIMAGLATHKASKKWADGFIKDPAGWLNGRRWEDEIESSRNTQNATSQKPAPGTTRTRQGVLETLTETMGWVPA